VRHGFRLGAGAVHATTGGSDDHRLVAGQADGALVRVLEGAACLGEPIDPGLELGGNGEVVERSADDDDVGGEKLAHQALGDVVLAALRLGRRVLDAELDAQRVGAEVGGRGHRQVEVLDIGTGEPAAPLRDDLAGEPPGDGPVSKNAGVDVKRFHWMGSWFLNAIAAKQ